MEKKRWSASISLVPLLRPKQTRTKYRNTYAAIANAKRPTPTSTTARRVTETPPVWDELLLDRAVEEGLVVTH